MSWRKRKQHQESGENKSKLKGPRFHPIFAAMAASLLAIGYALATNPSHSLSAVWAFVIAAALGLYSFPLPKIVSIITMIAAIVIGAWLTANSFREVKDRRPYLCIKAIHSYVDKPSLKDNGTVVTLVIENAGDEPRLMQRVMAPLLSHRKNCTT